MKTFDVYLCRTEGRRVTPGRRADGVSWVAIERGPLDPRVAPPGAHLDFGPWPARSKQDAIDAAREARRGKLVSPRPVLEPRKEPTP